MEASSSSVLTCPVCFGTFRRAEHLRRHNLTHLDDKPHACPFCDARYKRSDALRRHWQTCKGRIASANEIPKRSLSGRRKKACARCASQKRACSTGTPCSECSLRGLECTYDDAQGLGKPPEIDYTQRASESALTGSIDSERLDQLCHSRKQRTSSKNADLSSQLQSVHSPQALFDFLLNFTKATGLNEAYNYSSQRGFSIPENPSFKEGSYRTSLFDDSTISNPFDCYLTEVEASLRGDLELSQPFTSNMTGITKSSIAEKANQLLQTLQPILKMPAFNNFDQSSLTGFFSLENLTRYLDLFWSRWYWHCPIIHKATFDLRSCSDSLFATMSLIGAFMSSLQEDHQGAKRHLNLIEELLFSNALFSETTFFGTKRDAHLKSLHNIQTLQATCLMCLLQKWEGDHAAKLRMQRHRFTALVAATRAMGLSQATHHRGSFGSPISYEEWKAYMLKEEMIRTFNHVFLLDSAFVIFHNSVPRMVLQEMTIDLTCPEDVFQASNPEQFLIAIESHPRTRVPPLLTDCVRNLCAEIPDPAITAHLHRESALNLFTIATAIHGLIFHQLRAFSPSPLATGSLRRALRRWESAWKDSTESSMNSDCLSKVGQECAFFQRAREFALLARVHIEKSHLSTEEWNGLAKKFAEEAAEESGEFLATFDQTGMDHVESLLLAIEDLNLN